MNGNDWPYLCKKNRLVENVSIFWLRVYPYALIAFCDGLPRWRRSDINCTIIVLLIENVWQNWERMPDWAPCVYPGTPSPMEVMQVSCSSHGSVQKAQWGLSEPCVQAIGAEEVLGTLKNRRVPMLLVLGQYSQGLRRLKCSCPTKCGFLGTLNNRVNKQFLAVLSFFGSSLFAQKLKRVMTSKGCSLSPAGDSC